MTQNDNVDYDAEDDFSRSIDECYRVIRERVARGGPTWEPQIPKSVKVDEWQNFLSCRSKLTPSLRTRRT